MAVEEEEVKNGGNNNTGGAMLTDEEEDGVPNYVEGCPGCQMDAAKAANCSIPYVNLAFVFIVVLASSLPISSLFPFLYYMIRDFHIAQRDEKIGYYAGGVGSAYLLGRALTSIHWGMAADCYGRKPVLLIGTISVVVFNTLFGFSTKYWMAITTRFLLGFLCGVLGPTKAYVMEVCRKEHQALGMSIISTSWGLGLVLGPAIGGFLAQPAEKFPHLVTKGSLLHRFPYLLPCLVISVIALVTAIGCYWLPETLHKHGGKEGPEKLEKITKETLHEHPREESLDDVEENTALEILDRQNSKEADHSSKRSLLKNWPLMSAILVYCVFQLHDTAYSEVFALWANSPRTLGGLSFSTSKVGTVLTVTGAGLLVFQLFFYIHVEKMIGPVWVARSGAFVSILLLGCYPVIARIPGPLLMVLLTGASMAKNILSVCIATGLSILQNRAVDQKQRGTANGISTAAMSAFKAAGPTVGGSLLSWAQSRLGATFLPGPQMIFFFLCLIEFIGLVMTFKPFLALPKS